MIKKPKYYVYQHIYNDGVNSRIVYIGKGSVDYTKSKYKGGSDTRAHTFAHRNKNYTNFVNRVGKENITIKIVARFDDESDALFLENELHEIHDNLYSISDKEVAKLNAKRPRKKKAIVQLSENGEFIKEYDSMKSAKADGFISSKISDVCNKRRTSHKGYRWLFASEYYSDNYWFKENKSNIPIVAITKDGVFYFKSGRECSKQLGIYAKDITNRNNNKYSKKHDLFVLKQSEYNNESYDELVYKYLNRNENK